MSKRINYKYTYDLSLDEGVGSRLITWVTGLMVFFVTLALAVNFGVSAVTKNWVTGLSGTLTIEIKPPLNGTQDGKTDAQEQRKFDDSIRQTLSFLKNNPAVSEARLLTRNEVKSLIEPWLGQGSSIDSLPLPALIDIKLAPEADAEALQGALKILVPSAVVDSHTDTLDDIRALIRTVSLVVLLLTGVIILLAVVSIAGIVKAKLLIHQTEVKTLHLVGASDEYIARQFRQHTLRGTMKGALTGMTCTFITLFVVGTLTHAFDASFFSSLKTMSPQWALLILSPLLAGSLIAHLTAQATVLRELAKLP